jgi:tetratricopeptide (TPR) repeat protein
MVLVETMSKLGKDHYEVLGVEKKAASQEIKRAYFTLVRKFPPERFPEEFKEVRAAYDTLMDEKKRAEYDDTGALPEAIKPLFYEARQAHNRGHHTQAAELYHSILQIHPELIKVREEYARTLDDTGKTGKAIEAWEQLCEQEPANAEYALCLAEAYDQRGWNKKAHVQYWQALELDMYKSECWMALINYHGKAQEWDEAQGICRQAMKTTGEKADIHLYLCAFSLYGSDDPTVGGKYLQHILRLAEENPPSEYELRMIVSGLLRGLISPDMMQFYPSVKKLADRLPDIDGELRRLLDRTERNFDSESLIEKGFIPLFHDLFVTLNNGLDSPEDQHAQTAIECVILVELDAYRPQLVRLKKEYPKLYDLRKDFFDEALRTRNPEKMMRQRMKKIPKDIWPAGFMDGEDEDDLDFGPPVQTVRRDSPKIGRNDPCPCGSGKKYKKCCGA